MKKLVLCLIILFLAVPAFAGEHCIFIIQRVDPYPTPVDPLNITPEEQAAIDAWQVIYDNAWGLYRKIDRAEEWLLSGEYRDVFRPGQGPLLTKAGLYGYLHEIPCEMIQKDNPGTWFANKIQALIDNGWLIRGWAVMCDEAHVWQDIQAFLAARNYLLVEPE